MPPALPTSASPRRSSTRCRSSSPTAPATPPRAAPASRARGRRSRCRSTSTSRPFPAAPRTPSGTRIMSLSVALFNALSGLQVNQTALQVTASNVANVNTPDYARKVHDQQNRLLGGMGAGVETAQIVRRIDQFLRRDLMQEIGRANVRTPVTNAHTDYR